MTEANPLIFYDISSPLQPQTYAPNPSKARLALSFKNVPFTTAWTDIIDIVSVRQGLKCAATRHFADGSDYFTLPMVEDPSSGQVWGDTFIIANALDDRFPDSGAGLLFPPDSSKTGLDYESPHKDSPIMVPLTTNKGAKNQEYARFNVQVDATFTSYVMLFIKKFPFNPDTADAVKAMMCKRGGLSSWDDLKCEGEMRTQMLGAFKEALTTLAQLFTVHEGPYLEGEKANYADLIVGGWLNYSAILLMDEEWVQLREWHGGVFARLYDALMEKYWLLK